MAPIERFNYVLKQRRTKSLAALEKVMKEEPSGSTMSLNSVGQQMGLSSPNLQNERNLHATKKNQNGPDTCTVEGGQFGRERAAP